MTKIQTNLKAMLGTVSKSLVALSKQVEKKEGRPQEESCPS